VEGAQQLEKGSVKGSKRKERTVSIERPKPRVREGEEERGRYRDGTEGVRVY